MALLQNGKAIFYHPLDDAVETLKSKTWTGSAQAFTAGKVGSSLSRVDISADLSGLTADYGSVAGSTKVAFCGWLRNPSGAPPTTAAPTTDSPIGDAATSTSGTGVNGATVEVFVNGGSVGNADAAVSGGTWSKTGMAAVSTGDVVSSKQRSTGELQSAESNEVTVQAYTAAPTTDSPIGDAATSCSGTGVNGATVEVFVDDVSVGNADAVVAGGTWSKTGMTALSTGEVVSAKQTESGKLQSAESNEVTVQAYSDAPTVDSPITAGSTSVSGTSTEADGTTIQVYVNGAPSGSTTSVSGGTWTKSGLSALSASDTVKAKATAPSELESGFSNEVTVSYTPTGYIAGGAVGNFFGATTYTTINKLDFASDTWSTLTSGLASSYTSGTRGSFASATDGFKMGGRSEDGASSNGAIDKLSFGTETVSTLASSMQTAGGMGMGFASSDAGYAGGYTLGNLLSPPYHTATIDKLAFSSESTSNLASSLTAVRGSGAGFASTTAGYAAGGRQGGSRFAPVTSSVVDKLTFSSDAVAALSSSMSYSAHRVLGGFASSTDGYVGGGQAGNEYGPSMYATVDKWSFSTDNRSTLASTLSIGRSGGHQAVASASYGYFCGGSGGNYTGPSSYTTVDKFDFATDARSVLASGTPGYRHTAGFDNV